MTLKEYIKEFNTSIRALAKEIPCSQPHLCNISNGLDQPSYKLAVRIEMITKKLVPRTNWYE